jgi:hypothetical protein
MSLPSKLLYNNKINASYARNFNSVIQAQNTQNYGLGQTAIFNIPCMRNQVLSGADTMLSLRLRTRNGGTINNGCLNKGGIASAIQRLRIFSGSQLLCDIDNYGTLISLLTPWQSSLEHVRGKLQLLQGTGYGRGLQIMTALAANADNVDYDFAFPLLSILSLTDNYVPLWAMASNGPLRVEVQFVDALTKFIGATTAITNHSDGVNTVFSDCKLIANFVELSDSAMAIIENSLEGKPVQWVCQSYANYVFSTTLQNAVTQVSIPIPAKYNSLKALYMVMRTSDASAGALASYADNFLRFGMTQYTTRIGSRVIPAEPPNTIPQFVAEMERALGSASSRISPSSYTYDGVRTTGTVTPLQSIGTLAGEVITLPIPTGSFAVGIETESYSSAPMGSVYQGLNTSTDDIFWQGTFAAQGAATVVRFDAYASYDQLITIDNGVVQVQY